MQTSGERFCPTCGTRGMSAFCPNDGTEMKPVVLKGMPAAAPVAASLVAPPDTSPPPPHPPKPPRWNAPSEHGAMWREVPQPNAPPSPAPPTAPEAAQPIQPPRTRPKRTRVVMAVIAVAIVLVLAAIVVSSLSRPPPPSNTSPSNRTQGAVSAELAVSGCTALVGPVVNDTVHFCITRSSVPLNNVMGLNVTVSDSTEIASITRGTVCQDGIPVGTNDLCAVVLMFTEDTCGATISAQATVDGVNAQGQWVPSLLVASTTYVWSC